MFPGSSQTAQLLLGPLERRIKALYQNSCGRSLLYSVIEVLSNILQAGNLYLGQKQGQAIDEADEIVRLRPILPLTHRLATSKKSLLAGPFQSMILMVVRSSV